MNEYISCFACGAKCLNIPGESHKYMLAAPGCWAMFCEIMAKEFSDVTYWKAHQFTVDAYAAQHVGKKEDKRAVNSVNIHLASLYAIFEEGMPTYEAPELRKQFSQHFKGTGVLKWLEPPNSLGEMTVYDPWNNEKSTAHFDITKNWAKSVWDAWSHQHEKIAELFEQVKRKR